MPTPGFLFARNNNGSNRAPIIKRMQVLGTGAFLAGDLLVVDAATGWLKLCVTGVTEVTAIALQARPAAGAVSGDWIQVGLIKREHVYRCSSDAASTAAIANGVAKAQDIINAHQVKVSTTTGGTLQLWDASKKDDAGNLIAEVSFTNVTGG